MCPPKPNFEPFQTPPKKPKLRQYSASKGTNPGPSPEKLNLEAFRTHLNPPKIPNFEPTNWVGPNTNLETRARALGNGL